MQSLLNHTDWHKSKWYTSGPDSKILWILWRNRDWAWIKFLRIFSISVGIWARLRSLDKYTHTHSKQFFDRCYALWAEIQYFAYIPNSKLSFYWLCSLIINDSMHTTWRKCWIHCLSEIIMRTPLQTSLYLTKKKISPSIKIRFSNRFSERNSPNSPDNRNEFINL